MTYICIAEAPRRSAASHLIALIHPSVSYTYIATLLGFFEEVSLGVFGGCRRPEASTRAPVPITFDVQSSYFCQIM